MRRSSATQWALGWILIAFAGAVPNEAAPATKISDAFTIHVRNYANVDSKTLAAAEKVAGEIFRHARVGARWVDEATGNPVEIKPEGQGAGTSLGVSDLSLSLYTHSMAEVLRLSDKVMGLPPGSGPDRQMVFVFYDSLEPLAERQVVAMRKGDITRPATRGQILGHMIAHELGHVLLNQTSHLPVGIMRGDWTLKDLQDAAFGTLLFTPQQSEVLRAEVARRTEQTAALGRVSQQAVTQNRT